MAGPPVEMVLVENPDLAIAQNSDFSIRTWKAGAARIVVDEFRPIPGSPPLSRLTARVSVRRLIWYHLVQVFFPLVIIVAMSGVPFWIGPDVIPARVGTSVTTVLTLIAYRFMLVGFMPKLPYLTMLDYLLLGAMFLVAASLAIVTVECLLVRGRPEIVAKIDRVGRIVHPVSILLLISAVYLFM